MNNRHYDKGFLYSEILGKFTTIGLEPFTLKETEALIKKRLDIAGNKNYFDSKIMEKIYDYSRGIPRNIVSAGNLLVNASNGETISIESADKILGSEFLEKVIDDRVGDTSERLLYKQMVAILRNKFDKRSTKQEDYCDAVVKQIGISRATVLKKITYLSKLGVLKITKGGKNRVNKIISID